MKFAELNALSPREAAEIFYQCCACHRWAEAMVSARPYADLPAVLSRALGLWEVTTEAEQLEAYAGHPKIGDLGALSNKYADTASREQGQIAAADEQILKALLKGNDAYVEANGFIFIVCATGKTAAEMLAILQSRLTNSRQVELENAAAEQAAITRLRLKALVKK